MADGTPRPGGPGEPAGREPHAAPAPPPDLGPIVAAPGESAAAASRPDQPLDDARYHIYEANPAPWWIGLGWIAFLVFGAIYLIVNLLD
ncbi:MAG: hypothetical protein AB1689_05320 [Thermodesulfobacteriota bacterium]